MGSRGSDLSLCALSQFLDFTRTIDPAFKQYDEDGALFLVPAPTPTENAHERLISFFRWETAAWPSVIDDFVEYARARI